MGEGINRTFRKVSIYSGIQFVLNYVEQRESLYLMFKIHSVLSLMKLEILPPVIRVIA